MRFSVLKKPSLVNVDLQVVPACLQASLSRQHLASLFCVFLVFLASAHAEISLSSMGNEALVPHRTLELDNGEYAITQDLGTTAGNNLFHSFHRFNLEQGETATFSGANHIENVISRVTGGSPSNINGTIKNTIPNADTYLLNPAGIMFGEQAQLDVQGSFHASTADSLTFADGAEFHTNETNISRFSVSSPQSFGFFDKAHAAIEVKGRSALNDTATPRALLQVPDGKSLSLIGGDIRLSQGVEALPLEPESSTLGAEGLREAVARNQRYSQLHAPSGRLNLAAMQGAGEVRLSPDGIDTTMQGATFETTGQAFLSTTGEGGGNVFIRAGDVKMDNSTLYARTLGSLDGGVVDMQADRIQMQDTIVRAGTDNTGDGTDIRMSATESLVLTNNTPLISGAGRNANKNQTLGDAGYIHLYAKDIEISHNDWSNGVFTSLTYGSGRGGDIVIQADNQLDVIGAYFQSSTWAENATAGDAGDIYLQAKAINVVNNSAAGTYSNGSGNAGDVFIKADRLYMNGEEKGFAEIRSYNWAGSTGHAGNIQVEAREVVLEEGGFLSTSTMGSGDAGQVSLALSGDLRIAGASQVTGKSSGIFAYTQATGNINSGKAGHIEIQARAVSVAAGGRIDASSQAVQAGASSGVAGDIRLSVAEGVSLHGVNPYGENTDGFASSIAARSRGEQAGAAGDILISAKRLELSDGALIESGVDNLSQGGSIRLDVLQSVDIEGDAAHIALQAPLSSQQDYLARINPVNYNQAVSGIYAHSTSPNAVSGDSGAIDISTAQLSLRAGGEISTASQGGGKAGNITLQVGALNLSDHAVIRSDSELRNHFFFDSAAQRDAQLICVGTVVKTVDVGDGRSVYQINLGQTLVNLMPITQVADMDALHVLSENINLAASGTFDSVRIGDIVTVADTGAGQSARFIYTVHEETGENWVRINENSQAILPRFDTIIMSGFYDVSQPPYANGTQLRIQDMGNGKGADFIYIVVPFITEGQEHFLLGQALRVRHYQLTEQAELNTLSNNSDLLIGTLAEVTQAENGNPARFVFDGADWVLYGGQAQSALEVPTIAAREALVLAQPGHIASLPDGDSIYTGQAWINLGDTYRVADLAARDALNPQRGDLVKVADIDGSGRHDAFLYLGNGDWQRQIRGGNAGEIAVHVDEMHLSADSAISTASISGGGGSINIDAQGLAMLKDSHITTSVQEGAGNGGDLHISTEFLVQDQAAIIARAIEGNGGNIQISSKSIFQFGGESVNPIDASSQLGQSGQVELTTPDENALGNLFVINGQFVQQEIAPFECAPITSLDELSRYRQRTYPDTQTRTADWYQ